MSTRRLSYLLALCMIGMLQSLRAQWSQEVLAVSQQMPTSFVPVYQFDTLAKTHYRLPMAFNSALPIQKTIQIPPDWECVQVDLVYTDFQRGGDFSQLNLQRLQSLFEIYPAPFRQGSVVWKAYAQQACTSLQEAQGLWHGLVLYFAQPAKASVSKISQRTDKSDSIGTSQRPPLQETDDLTIQLAQFLVEQQDSTTFKAIDRFIPNLSRSKFLFVIDWTASMYDQGAQIMLWLQNNSQFAPQMQDYVFFNDGDDRPDAEKIAGKTGGIYYVKGYRLDSLLYTMQLAQSRGGGGDAPENDLEAVWAGINACSNCDQVVLIADAKSEARDMELLKKVASLMKQQQQVLRIVLCDVGVLNNLSPLFEYIKMAQLTEGVLETEGQQVNFKELNRQRSATFELGFNRFKVEEGKVSLLPY